MHLDPVHARNLLGVPHGASSTEVRTAFRQRARELHPDTAEQHRSHVDADPDAVGDRGGRGLGGDPRLDGADRNPTDDDIGRLREARDLLVTEQRSYRRLASAAPPTAPPTTRGWQPYSLDLDPSRRVGVYRLTDDQRSIVDLRI